MLTDAQLEHLGLLPQPGIATAYPELIAEFNKLYSERVAKLTFLPQGWLTTVLENNGKGGTILFPIPPFMANGTVKPGLPSFLQTEGAREVWKALNAEYRKILIAYAAARAEEGRAELKKLYAAAAFWDGLYNTAVFVRDLPSTAVNTVTNAAFDVVFGNLGKLGWKVWLVVGIAGVGAAIYFAPRVLAAKKLVTGK
jgi:hypothetical protein